jgi:uncharacterized protein (DUF305 family)
VRPATPHPVARDDKTAQPDRERLGPPLSLISAIAAFLALFVALVALVSSRDPGNSSAEAGFARDMSVHHAQAVEMAEIVRDKTDSEQIRTMAADIALTQQAQIGQMQGWLDVWGLPPTGTEPAMSWMGHPTEGRMPGMASPEEINRLRDAPPDEADEMFLRLMIRHHKAALPMARAVLERTDRPEVRRLATAIVSSQKGEIRIMQEMLKSRGGKPEQGSPSHTREHNHSELQKN